jgi:hypothetical protein
MRQRSGIAGRRGDRNDELPKRIIAARRQKHKDAQAGQQPHCLETCLHQNSTGATGLNAESLNYCEDFIVTARFVTISPPPAAKTLETRRKGGNGGDFESFHPSRCRSLNNEDEQSIH